MPRSMQMDQQFLGGFETSETKGDKTYTELITFQFVQDKCDLLNEKKEGDAVKILFNLKGRKWTNPQGEVKYFNSLQAWRIMPHQQNAQGQGQADGPPEGFSDVPPPGFDQNLQENVPF